MKKGIFTFFFAVLGFIFLNADAVQAAECNPQCVYSGRCGDGLEYLPGSTCGSSRAPGILCQERGCTPAGQPTVSAAQCTQQGGACQAQCNGPSASVPRGQEFLGWCPSTSAGERLGCCKNRTGTAGGGVPNPGETTGTGVPTPTTGSAISITLTNPLRYDTVEGVLTSVMSGIKGIVVVLAILMIVIGGIMYILSFGNDGRMKTAKNVILAALVGLAIVIAAPAFLREISLLLGWQNAPAIEGGTQLTLTQIARNILNFLLSIIGVLALIVMIISGIMYLTSGGNENRMKQAKNMFVASLIGIAVAMASLILVSAVARFFG